MYKLTTRLQATSLARFVLAALHKMHIHTLYTSFVFESKVLGDICICTGLPFLIGERNPLQGKWACFLLGFRRQTAKDSTAPDTAVERLRKVHCGALYGSGTRSDPLPQSENFQRPQRPQSSNSYFTCCTPALYCQLANTTYLTEAPFFSAGVRWVEGACQWGGSRRPILAVYQAFKTDV